MRHFSSKTLIAAPFAPHRAGTAAKHLTIERMITCRAPERLPKADSGRPPLYSAGVFRSIRGVPGSRIVATVVSSQAGSDRRRGPPCRRVPRNHPRKGNEHLFRSRGSSAHAVFCGTFADWALSARIQISRSWHSTDRDFHKHSELPESLPEAEVVGSKTRYTRERLAMRDFGPLLTPPCRRPDGT